MGAAAAPTDHGAAATTIDRSVLRLRPVLSRRLPGPDAVDYDCAGGTGDGPEYVRGPIRVRPTDPFDLDREGDGVGCESG